MVNHALRSVLFALTAAMIWVVAPMARAITPAEIRVIDDEAARKQKAKAARLKPGEVDQLLPPAKSARVSSDTEGPRSTKYSGSASSAATLAPRPADTTREPLVRFIGQRPAHEVAPSSPDATATTTVRTVAPADAIRSDGVQANTKKYFGIPLGTWFQVSLGRNVSNAESGQVELTVVEEVPGTRRSMPTGTLLFAEKTYNHGTKRLDCRAVRGITPKGVEFRISALCFDLQKVAGLNGIVSVDEKAVANKGLQRGVLSALRTAATSVNGSGSIAAQGIQGAADSVLSDTGHAADLSAGPIYTIFVAPQTMLVRVDDSL